MARTRQSKFQENTLLTNQTNVTANLATGGIEHAITGGFEFISEEQYNPAYVRPGHADHAGESLQPEPQRCAAGLCAGAQRRVHARRNADLRRVHLRHADVSPERWELTGGFRIDSFDTNFDGASLSTAVTHPTLPVGTLVPTSLQAQDKLFSYKIGLLFKPGRERQHLSFECHVAAAPGRQQLPAEHRG